MLSPLCRQTVTVYRHTDKGVERFMAENCFYRWEDKLENGLFIRKFLLICPGERQILPGDRIFDGIGPEQVDWAQFIPVSVPGLAQAEYGMPWRLEGKITHWEAGRK